MGERLVITEEIMGIWAEEVASIEREITRLNARSDTYRKKIDASRVLLAAQSVEMRPTNRVPTHPMTHTTRGEEGRG